MCEGKDQWLHFASEALESARLLRLITDCQGVVRSDTLSFWLQVVLLVAFSSYTSFYSAMESFISTKKKEVYTLNSYPSNNTW
jgi:hypothetical protein